MTEITVAQILDAFKTTFAAAADVVRGYNEIKEGINDPMTLQIYWQSLQQDPSGNVAQTTFGGGVRQTILIIHLDLYVKQRSEIGEELAQLVTAGDVVTPIFEAQKHPPYFGLAGIQGFSWSAERVTFAYGNPQMFYSGIRYISLIRVY